MNAWADDAAAKWRKEDEAQRVKDARFNEQQRLKQENGHILWHEVRSQVRDSCKAFNVNAGKEVLVFDLVQNMTMQVRYDTGGKNRVLNAAFDTGAGRLSWGCGDKHLADTLAVSDQGEVYFAGSTTLRVTDIAQAMLDALLFGGTPNGN